MNSASLPLAELFDLLALNHKVIGASGGFGRAFVLALDGAGPRVAVLGHSTHRRPSAGLRSAT